MKILVAVDGSEFTRRMVAYWAAHEEWLGPQHSYTVLTVVPPIENFSSTSMSSVPAVSIAT